MKNLRSILMLVTVSLHSIIVQCYGTKYFRQSMAAPVMDEM